MGNFNGCLGGSRVWEFRSESATWIVWRVGHDPPTPRAGSAAAAWPLPPCTDLAPASMFDKSTAAAVARLLRAIRRREGLVILHDRVFGRSGPAKPIGGCRSIRELSRTLGVSFWRARAIYEASSGDAANGIAVGEPR